MGPSTKTPQFHTIVTTVENKPGVLARVAGLFSRRGFNIRSLAVAPTDDVRFSRITFTVDVESAPLEQVVKQLDKLINVVTIRELDPAESIARELMMVSMHVDSASRAALTELVERFHGRVLVDSETDLLISLASEPDDLDEMENQLRPFGIVEMQRTGRVAMPLKNSARPR